MKWFEIPEQLIPKLRELQKNDADDPIVKSDDAVVMFYGLGGPMYLTFDGRVIIDEGFGENDPRVAETFVEAAMAIVAGAEVRDFPELLTILPERPPNAFDCQNCEKTGWFRPGGILGPFVCGQCGGLGWKLNEESD